MSQHLQQLLPAYGTSIPVVPIALVINSTTFSTTTASLCVTNAIDTTGSTAIYIVLGDFAGAGAATAPTDSKGNTYVAGSAGVLGGTWRSQVWYCKNPIVGSGHTFTKSLASSFPAILALGFNGTDTTANVDQSHEANATAVTTLAPGSITPSVANEVVVSGIASIGATSSINGGFTQVRNIPFNTGVSVQLSGAYLIQTSPAASNPTWTIDAANDMYACQASFKHS